MSRWRPKQHANCHLQHVELLELRDLRGDRPRELVEREVPVVGKQENEGGREEEEEEEKEVEEE